MHHGAGYPFIEVLFNDLDENAQRSFRKHAPGGKAVVQQAHQRGSVANHPVLGRLQDGHLVRPGPGLDFPRIVFVLVEHLERRTVENHRRFQFAGEVAQFSAIYPVRGFDRHRLVLPCRAHRTLRSVCESNHRIEWFKATEGRVPDEGPA